MEDEEEYEKFYNVGYLYPSLVSLSKSNNDFH
jgi:hypothetical protein